MQLVYTIYVLRFGNSSKRAFSNLRFLPQVKKISQLRY